MAAGESLAADEGGASEEGAAGASRKRKGARKAARDTALEAGAAGAAGVYLETGHPIAAADDWPEEAYERLIPLVQQAPARTCERTALSAATPAQRSALPVLGLNPLARSTSS